MLPRAYVRGLSILHSCVVSHCRKQLEPQKKSADFPVSG